MIPRGGALVALMDFLEQHLPNNKIGSLSINRITRMARLILDTNSFAYNNAYYKQSRGGAMGSALTQVLANIYMYKWEQHLIKHQGSHKQIYGRLVKNIYKQINFDITIKNENEQLKTSMYHKPATGTYILSYASDHPRYIHQNIPHATLLRATRIFFNVYDLNSERIRIDMSLLMNN
ncbi:unnamed protein product [Rotaria sp. Silwood2]|nr:unnamed protein product [Rotaria sp. Silwood2]CAF4456761.1 unnamed protein product [Rotaria sp. Silwood2]